MCIFCEIINQEIPAYKIYEDDHYLAFLDIAQVTKGHTLIIPKKHVSHFLQADDLMISEIMILAHKIAQQLKDKLHCNGMNLLSNIEEVAGQSVPHFHVHIIPRYDEKDALSIQFNENTDKNIEETYRHIIG